MEASTKKLIAVLLAAVMMTSVAGGMVGAQEQQPQLNTEDVDAAVSFSDQTTDGTSVTVDAVNTSDGGFVVIHDSSLLDGNVTGSVIGVSEYLEPGLSENVTVTLFDGVPGAEFNQTELTEDETLIAMPHRDTNENGTYDFVTTDGEEDGPYLDNETAITDSANVTVEEPSTTGESFAVSNLTAPEVIEQGDELTVNASIENPNDEADTQTVEYRFNGDVLEREELDLDAGESVEFETSLNTSDIEADQYIHGVYTRDRGQPAQILVAEEIESFEVSNLTAPETATIGDEITVNATVTNPNEFANEQGIQFRFDGDLVESQDVALDGEDSTTVEFQVNTQGIPPGTYIHSIFSDDFGQDAIITIETPGEGPPDEGEGPPDEGEDETEDSEETDEEETDDSEETDEEETDDSEETDEDETDDSEETDEDETDDSEETDEEQDETETPEDE